MTLLVLHHTDDVGLGALTLPLEERGIQRRDLDPSADETSLEGATGLLLLGGDPGAVPESELALVRSAWSQELPIFGICHGAEVIAAALGGSVVRRDRPEVGMVALHRTTPGREDDVAAGWPDGAAAFAMHHGAVAALPRDTDTLLIGSDGPSLWRHGSAYGTPLHLEADADTIMAWLDDSNASTVVTEAGLDPQELREDVERRRRFLPSAGLSLLLRWLDGNGITPTD